MQKDLAKDLQKEQKVQPWIQRKMNDRQKYMLKMHPRGSSRLVCSWQAPMITCSTWGCTRSRVLQVACHPWHHMPMPILVLGPRVRARPVWQGAQIDDMVKYLLDNVPAGTRACATIIDQPVQKLHTPHNSPLEPDGGSLNWLEVRVEPLSRNVQNNNMSLTATRQKVRADTYYCR